MYHNLYYYILKERDKLIMSVNIDDIEYNYEDEELDNIQYLEIISLDDIIKDNPSFIALSRKDIKDSLFELFVNNKKADDITNLFYNILNDIEDNRGKLKKYDNYIFNAEVEKIDSSYDTIDKNDALNFNNLKKKSVLNHDIAKDKYFFCIKYNNDSTKLRLKPTSKINITIEPNNKYFPIYYPVYPIDDVNIPIISAYYKIPKVIINDYIYTKITSHLTKTKNINYVSSEDYDNINDLVKDIKPDIHNIIEYLKKCFDLDYYNIEIALNKFGKSLDFINKDDFDILCDYLTKVIGIYKERKNISRPVKIKRPDIINKKLIFFEKLSTTIQLLNLTENIVDFLDKNKMILDNERENNIITQKIKPLADFKIYEIIQEIKNTGNYENEEAIIEILDIIKHSLKNSNILEAIHAIDNILKTYEKKELIIKKYEIVKKDNEYSRNHIFDYDKDGKQYIISYRESKEIKDSHNIDNYEGIPDKQFVQELKMENDDNIVYNDYANNDKDDNIYFIDFNKLDINKYITNINYKNELGFVNSLEPILNIMYGISKLAYIDFDYDVLCIELFKYNRSIYNRRDLYTKTFQDNDIEVSEEIINCLDKLSPETISSMISNKKAPFTDIDDNEEKIINECNNIWIDDFNDMFLNALTYCIIYIQERILNDTIFIDIDYLNGNFISYWDNCGTPLHKKEDRGVMTYLIEIVKEYFNINNDFKIDIDKLFGRIYDKIEDNYKEILEIMKKNDEICKEKKKKLRGKEERNKLAKLNTDKQCGNKLELCKEQFILSLLYMPDINYKKIHKFLNGCCLKKLDDSFNDNIDFKNAKRNDLIQFKEYYAKIRMTNKRRDLRFIPKKDNTLASYEENAIVNPIYLDDYIVNINNNSKIVNIWLSKMKEKNNSIFPVNIIEYFENNNTKTIKASILFNINLLTKTSKHAGNEFIDNFNNVRKNIKGNKDANDKIKYLNIIRAIIKILYNNLQNKDNSDDINILLENSINDLKNIIIDLKDLNNIYNDEIENDINLINKYIVSRALCCPFNIDETLNEKIISNVINQQYIQKITNNIYETVLKIIKLSFPSIEENIDFLNKQREENKQGKIKILNDKTVEDNKLIKEMKKAGIKHAIIQEKINEGNDVYDNDDIFKDISNNDNNNVLNDIINNDIIDNNIDGADTDNLMTYDREDDDEYMDTQEMGFIYN